METLKCFGVCLMIVLFLLGTCHSITGGGCVAAEHHSELLKMKEYPQCNVMIQEAMCDGKLQAAEYSKIHAKYVSITLAE